jgi:hypothetical protein
MEAAPPRAKYRRKEGDGFLVMLSRLSAKFLFA